MLKNNRFEASTNVENKIYMIINDTYSPVPYDLRQGVSQLFKAFAEAILDEIYTEKELMEKAEHIILDKQTETDSI